MTGSRSHVDVDFCLDDVISALPGHSAAAIASPAAVKTAAAVAAACCCGRAFCHVCFGSYMVPKLVAPSIVKERDLLRFPFLYTEGQMK